MQRILVFNIMLLAGVISKGQAPFPTVTEIKQFTESKTCVVSDSDPFSPFNMNIRQAMEEYWDITPYEFIGEEEFKSRRKDPEWSFIVVTETSFDKDRSNSTFYFINLLQGKSVNSLSEMPEICAIPLSFTGEEDPEYGYKLGAVLMFMQSHARLISKEPSVTGRRYLTYYNKNVPLVAGKTILVVREDLSPDINTIEKIRSIYSEKIEIVEDEDIIKAVREKAQDCVVLHLVGPPEERNAGYCFKMLIGTDDSEMYYYDQHRIDRKNPRGLLPSDLKRLSRF